MPSLRSCALFLALPLLSASLTGCGGTGDMPELGLVTGTLTESGKPVAGATLEFIPEKGRPSFATTGPDGRFEVEYGADQPGAVIGKHRVTVTTGGSDAATAAAGDNEEPVLTATKTRALPTPVEVTPGENTLDLDLAQAR